KSAENANFIEIVYFLNVNPNRCLNYEIVHEEREHIVEMAATTAASLDAEHDNGGSPRRQDTILGDRPAQTRRDRVERAATTAASLDAKKDIGTINRTQSTAIPNEPIPSGTSSGGSPRRQDTILGDRPAQTRFERLSKQSHEPPLSRVNTLGSGEDSMQLMELMELCTKLFARALTLENNKTAQDLEITHVKKRVKSINLIVVELVTIVNAPVTTVGVSVSTGEPSTPPTTTITTTVIEDEDLTISQTLMKMRSEKSKEKAKERGSKEKSSETATRPTRRVIMREASETTTRKTIPPQKQLDPKDKGKGKMIEPEKPLKKKDRIKFDREVAQRLEARLQAEVEEEERIARQKEEDANIAEWDDVQAMMDADHELAKRLHAEEQGELSIKERSKLFVELMNQRKTHFARLKAEEKRRKPPTKAQKKNQMLVKDRAKGSETRAEGSSKRVGEELEFDKSKKQKLDEKVEAEVDNDQEEAEMKMYMKIENIDKEDLKPLWKLVKAKYGNTMLEEAYERVLWGDLKVMFEPNIECKVWRKLQGKKVIVWKLFYSSGIHFVRFQNLHIFMLVEKRYTLTPATITKMLNRKLQADHWNEMCYQLLKLMLKQQKKK
nr:hypothetical protein [Tanacetum cinerariifolium]